MTDGWEGWEAKTRTKRHHNLNGDIMSKINWPLVGAVIVMTALLVLLYSVDFARARDLGQWSNSDPAISQWYKTLMQPDNEAVPCCGESDAYWADSYEVSPDGEYIAIITDDRPDEPLRRQHIDVGTRIVIPKYKLKYDQSNPTGHGIVFTTPSLYVYCYVAPGGV